jgi:MFS family permease
MFHLRTILLVLLWMCNICLYLARTNITVAVIFMFPSSESIEGTLLAAFYWGYTVSQIPGGWFASKFGPKFVLGCAVLLWSLSTISSGFVGKSVPILFLLRALVGIAEGANYPSQMELISRWIPHEERSRAWSFVVTGEAVGTIIALVGGPFVAHSYGWEAIFFISGGSSILWLALFLILTSSSPSTHSRITREELIYIEKSRPPKVKKIPTPWYSILTNKHLLFVVLTHCCYNFGYYVCLSWIQKFFSICYGADYKSLGILSVLPYITIFFCLMIAGNLADCIEIHYQWNPTNVRKLFNTVGMVGAGFFFFLLSLRAPTHINPIVTNSSVTTPSSSVDLNGATIAAILLACANGIGGFAAGGGYWPSLGDLSVEHSSVIVGISNSIASIPGIVGGNFVGNLLNATGNNWALVFQIAASIEVLGAILFLIGGSAEDQNFGKMNSSSSSSSSSSSRNVNERMTESLLVNSIENLE